MSRSDLEQRMRTYETAHDHCVLPGLFIVARIDGRNFTRLTKEIHDFDTPYDERFRDLMLDAMRRVMDCGFRIVYGYAQSDEFSVLFHRGEELFNRKERKFNSVLASEATSSFVLGLGGPAAFDCRLSQLTDEESVLDYFRWRQSDAARNALNAHAYWLLRDEGADAPAADKALVGLSSPEKHDLLFSHGVNFNNVPEWQRRGVGAWWEQAVRPPATTHPNAKPAARRELQTDLQLPIGEAYDELIRARIRDATAP